MSASRVRNTDADVVPPAATDPDAWFDEAVVVDEDWAVIYTTRDDGSRRGIRVPLRAVLAPDDDTEPADTAGATTAVS